MGFTAKKSSYVRRTSQSNVLDLIFKNFQFHMALQLLALIHSVYGVIHMTAANSRTGLNNLASNRTSGTTAGVQNSLKKCEMCGFPLEQINVIPNPTITSSGVSNNGVNVHEWSVIRLLNYSSNSSEQLKLSPFQLMPIHFVSVDRIIY